MKKNPSSKLAIVTGGSSGIGKAIARKLSDKGIRVVIADIKPSKEEENIKFKYCDVKSSDDIDQLYTWTVDNLGHPDILILAAGQGIHESLSTGDPEKWQEIVMTNLLGPLRIIRAFTPHMLKEKYGHVFFLSSVSAQKPHPYGGIYAASKAALDVIAETLRLETLPHLNVTVISPGIVDTDFFKNEISRSTDVEDFGIGAISAEEIAEDVMYALSKNKGTSINKIVTRPTLQSF